ncbi:MAG: alkaline phosphatase family protein [Clostridia bacterium]|nr:alkaline phosphatase family protein [Clostridia bacterium]
MSKKKLIIISNDALVREDMDYLLTKPLMKELVAKGSWVETLKTVYPSITYCCHASMITGCYPEKTHLYNNEVDEYGCKDWNWERKSIRVKTLIDAAKDAGCTTANVFWPVLGNDPNIDYNIAEYWSQTPEEPLVDALRRMGSSEQVLKEIVEPNLYYIDGHQRQHPFCDEFIFACARDMIVKYQPDLLVLHPAGIDGKRHQCGIFNDEVTEQLDYTYYWIEKLVRALKEQGLYEDTNIILTSDHGQMDVKRRCNPNALLLEAGIRPEQAYVKPVGGSAQVFIGDRAVYEKVYRLFKDAAEAGIYGFERVYTKEEAQAEERLAGDFELVLESDGYTTFSNSTEGRYMLDFDFNDYRQGHGTHGYLPEKGPQPSMVMIGPDFKKGVRVPRRNTVDMAVTAAHVMGWSLPDADGEIINEVLEG